MWLCFAAHLRGFWPSRLLQVNHKPCWHWLCLLQLCKPDEEKKCKGNPCFMYSPFIDILVLSAGYSAGIAAYTGSYGSYSYAYGAYTRYESRVFCQFNSWYKLCEHWHRLRPDCYYLLACIHNQYCNQIKGMCRHWLQCACFGPQTCGVPTSSSTLDSH